LKHESGPRLKAVFKHTDCRNQSYHFSTSNEIAILAWC